MVKIKLLIILILFIVTCSKDSDDNNNDEIAVINISTKQITRLTNVLGWDTCPSWK